MNLPRFLNLFAFAALGMLTSGAFAQSTAFTYQGRLNDGASPANGSYDLTFSLFATNNGGGAVAGPVTNAAVAVSNGLFSTTVDFGDAFTGADRWLELAVSTNGANAFSVLTPRQALTPAPTALFANSASNLSGTVSANQVSGNLPATQLTGTLSFSQLPPNVITNGASGVNFTGIFTGNGAGITNVDVRTLRQEAGNVVAWGLDSVGQSTPPPGLSDLVAIAAGDHHNLALRKNGTVIAWGNTSSSQTSVPGNLSNVVAIAAGGMHSMALRGNGTVVTWGDNSQGQRNVPAGLSNVVAIAGGFYHSLALRSNGTVVAWGFIHNGVTTVPPGLSNVVAIAAGNYHTLALRSNGTVLAWGVNADGQANVPVGLSNVVAIAGGESHSLGLLGNGTVVAWGDNVYGQTNIPTGLSNVVAIAVGSGGRHSLALISDGTVVGWGHNASGQTNIPAKLSKVVAIAGGHSHSLALRHDLSAQVALLTDNNDFLGTVSAVSFSGNGSSLTSLNAANVTGTLGTDQIPNLDASKITTGRLPDARLSTNVALLNRATQTFTGTNTFTDTLTVSGTFIGSASYLKYTEQYAKGTAAGGNVAGVNVRELNTEVTDTHNLGALSGGNVSLAAGTYYCRISAPAYRVDEHQIRLKTTGGTVLLYGTSEFSDDALSPGVQSRSQLEGQFMIGTTTTLQVEHFTTLAKSGNGLGLASSATWTDGSPVEIYSVAEFWKIR